ncbi:MAG: polysaccharide biosynthesis tyrosine autokinase [Nocardioidaceae bacterium]|nr:polysaccharide biosynthesis tyrosine autokinase [Nocardioidaceae bacterium]
MELTDQLRILRRRWLSIVIVALLAAGSALTLSLASPKQYSSTALLFVSKPDSDAATAFAGNQLSEARVQSYADLVHTRKIAEGVIDHLGLGLTPTALARHVQAKVRDNTVNLAITVTMSDPGLAQRVAEEYVEDLVDLVRDLETPPGKKVASIKATVVDRASYSATPVAPRPLFNTMLGGLLGLLAGIGIALLRDRLDTRVGSAADLSTLTGSSVLGAIGWDPEMRSRPLVTSLSSHAPRAEAFRVLRTNLQFVEVDSAHKVFVFSSAVPGEGKTSTSVNLALSSAQAGARTLLIEADLRRPRAARWLGLLEDVGVTSVLVGRIGVADAIQTDPQTGLDFLASGPVPPNPAELLQSQAMSEMLAHLRRAYDVVVIDAPPLLPVADAALLAAHADGVILVTRHGRTRRDQVGHCLDRLAQVDGRLVGVVLNMIRRGTSDAYGYGYGYGYAPLARHRDRSKADVGAA